MQNEKNLVILLARLFWFLLFCLFLGALESASAAIVGCSQYQDAALSLYRGFSALVPGLSAFLSSRASLSLWGNEGNTVEVFSFS